MRDRDQSAAFVAYPEASDDDTVARRSPPLPARPVRGKIDTDALIKRAMNRFPIVRAYLAR